MADSPIVEPLNKALGFMGRSQQANYIKEYASEVGANKIVIENDYIDKDYLIDFQKFYSRSFGSKVSNTTRVHFFSGEQSCDEFRELLISSHSTNTLQELYRGFVVVKPVYSKSGFPIIGRTVLSIYPEDGEIIKEYILILDREQTS